MRRAVGYLNLFKSLMYVLKHAWIIRAILTFLCYVIF